MHIREIELTNFMRHRATRVALPERGVVLITGPNGAGKSTLLEAVSTAFWGETLRSTPGWKKDADSRVKVTSDLVTAIRSKSKGGRNGLQFFGPDQDGPSEFENATKAHEALLPIVGSWDTWRRTVVFSSSDASGFTLSTDGERKRFLENILGLERFDVALDRCRKDLRIASNAVSDLETQVARLSGSFDAKRSALAGLASSGAPAEVGESEAALMEREAKLAKMIRATELDLQEMREKLRDLDAGVSTKRAELDEAERRAKRLSVKSCPTCGQVIPEELVEKLSGEVAKHRAVCSEAEAEAKAARASVEAERAELDGDRQALGERRSEATRRLASVREAARQREGQARSLAQLEAEAAQVAGQLSTLKEKLAPALDRAALVTAAEGILGLKGVRAHILGRALSGIERVAGSWFERLAQPGAKLLLRPYAEKASGGLKEAISLEVEGLGHEYGYKGSSGGERRRIDVALLLALGEVAAAARGTSPGTMFCDEVFDALDSVGVDATAGLLRELSAERAVVVVTHNVDLASRLSSDAAVRWKVQDGAILPG